MASIDQAILRLAVFNSSLRGAPKVVVNERWKWKRFGSENSVPSSMVFERFSQNIIPAKAIQPGAAGATPGIKKIIQDILYHFLNQLKPPQLPLRYTNLFWSF
jgi:hypothetical protein